MDVTPKKGEALDRTQVWLAAWVAVATSNSCLSAMVATDWADHCLKAFDERFSAATSPQAAPRRAL
ncbi:hypothetical protein [Bosea sp. BK604]|uniref:hypothetical protein n=1 Tax=Bosea sp. BK604 TaxID=2512180 RepID=UPI00104E0231|nr:hypothetical protein [Bosea sp. BK604]TCR69719.1 hypothetical protein EV560_101116 [Bosea sp. BK604]